MPESHYVTGGNIKPAPTPSPPPPTPTAKARADAFFGYAFLIIVTAAVLIGGFLISPVVGFITVFALSLVLIGVVHAILG